MIVWWLLMVIAGWVAWPLLYVSLPALPDRGYPAAKIAAWLIVAWVAWVGRDVQPAHLDARGARG